MGSTCLSSQHVLILDDVWTTGSTAQSAALAVRRAGAAAVSVMVVGRWLNPDRRGTADFIATWLQRDFDPDICPGHRRRMSVNAIRVVRS
jgi:hypoxanthine-guanine phosphoribosyltransferase